MRVLGIDPSLTNLGYVVLENIEQEAGSAPKFQILEKGRLQTESTDGLPLQRYASQSNGIAELVRKYDIKYVASEAPYYGDFNTEVLYGLHTSLHFTYWRFKLNVVILAPATVKSYAEPPVKKGERVFKSDMVKAARLDLGMRENERLANDVADAYFISKLGLRFWSYYCKLLTDDDLTLKEKHIFAASHTYTRGKKKGQTEKTGLIYRKNELFYIYGDLPEQNFLK